VCRFDRPRRVTGASNEACSRQAENRLAEAEEALESPAFTLRGYTTRMVAKGRRALGRFRALPLSLIAVVLAILGVAIYGSLPRDEEGSSQFADAHYGQKRFPAIGSPLIGANYTHYDFIGCHFSDSDILATYQIPAIRSRVHRELFAMRKNGVATLRTVIWHMTDSSRQHWGPIPSAGGRLSEPYRSNLINYVREVRKFGFVRLTIVFGPRGSNNPRELSYDPAKFNENWRFIQDVRSLVKQYGPRVSRFDILSEGAPSSYAPKAHIARVARYLRNMYTHYVRTFGKSDVTVSVIPARRSTDRGNRLQNLINILKSTGLGQPRWYDLHIGYTPSEAEHSLWNSDAVLARNHLSQPIIVGETAYNDRRIAKVIKTFMNESGRRIVEVTPWYIRWTKKCNVDPPYSVGAYRRELVTHRRHRSRRG
jgi:hypothetical protein